MRSQWHKWKTKITGMFPVYFPQQDALLQVHFYCYWCYDQQQNSQGTGRERTNGRVLSSLSLTAGFHYPGVVDPHNQINSAYSPVSMY